MGSSGCKAVARRGDELGARLLAVRTRCAGSCRRLLHATATAARFHDRLHANLGEWEPRFVELLRDPTAGRNWQLFADVAQLHGVASASERARTGRRSSSSSSRGATARGTRASRLERRVQAVFSTPAFAPTTLQPAVVAAAQQDRARNTWYCGRDGIDGRPVPLVGEAREQLGLADGGVRPRLHAEHTDVELVRARLDLEPRAACASSVETHEQRRVATNGRRLTPSGRRSGATGEHEHGVRAHGLIAVMHDEESDRRSRARSRTRSDCGCACDHACNDRIDDGTTIAADPPARSSPRRATPRGSAAPARRRRGGDSAAQRGAARLDLDRRPRAPADALGARRRVPRRRPSPRSSATGRVFEYWAHEASLLPVELWPHFRTVMDGSGHWGTHDRALREHAELVEPVLERIRAEGPLGSRDFEGQGGGGMWNWKPAKMVLDALWDRGELVIAGRRSFQRVYDLAERVIPKRCARRAGAERGGDAAHVRAARRARARRADRGGDPRALAAEGRQGAPAPSPRRARRRRAAARGAGRRRRAAVLRRPRRRARRRPRRRPCSSARSTTSSGTGRCSSACSASGT